MLRRGALVALLLSGCGFVRNTTSDPLGFSYDELSQLIADLGQARAAGVAYGTWASDHERAVLPKDGTWDEALGELHARRASSLVREAPVVSFTATWVDLFTDGFGSPHDSRVVQVLCLGIGTPLCVPFDLLIVPFSFTSAWFQDMAVDSSDHQRAMADLEQARGLGCLHAEWWMRSYH
ncbi:MAG TPA: hypothetical protein VF384_06840 [Planctomycetota bacterium]